MDGRLVGQSGSVSGGSATGIEKLDAGWPTRVAIACSSSARRGDVGDLGARRLQLGLGARDVDAGDDLALEQRLGQVERLLIGGDRIGQQLGVGIEAAQREIIGGQLAPAG